MRINSKNERYQIVIVEDNPGDYTLIEDYLSERFELPKITWTKNFKEARSILADNPLTFDLVLLDLTLPDKSGEDLINEMTSLCHEVPLIILTGHADTHFAIKSLSLGVSDYLIKDELDANSLYTSIVYNIERKRTLLQLEHSEKRYSDLFHLSPQPMWVYDIQSLRFLDVNLAAEKHYGYSLQEFLEMTITDIRPAEDVPEFLQKMEAIRENLPPFNSGVYRHKKKDGEIIHVEIQSNTIPFQNTIGRIILANDITDRVKYVEAIERQNKKLQEIAWIQSHLVRAPLARIIGLVDVIKNYGLDHSESQMMLGHLLESGNELDSIIRDITIKSAAIGLGKK